MFDVFDFVVARVYIHGLLKDCYGIIVSKQDCNIFTTILYDKDSEDIRLMNIRGVRLKKDKNKSFKNTKSFKNIKDKLNIISSYYCDYRGVDGKKTFHYLWAKCVYYRGFLKFINNEITIEEYLNIGTHVYSKPYIGSFKNVKQEIL